MQITQVRNATQILSYGGKKFLIDPMLADKEAYPGFGSTIRSEIRIPTVELPFDLDVILDVDAVILTHTHPDHWDEEAVQAVPKDKLIFVQNKHDEEIVRSQGFVNLKCLDETKEYADISIKTTACQHGYDALYANEPMAEFLGEVTGVIFEHADEEKLYIVGDTIWIPAVEETMKKEQPGVVILNTGWAHVLEFGPIIMGKEDVYKTHIALPKAKIVATHMEAVNHTLLTRKELREYVEVNQFSEFVYIPEDGETVDFN